MVEMAELIEDFFKSSEREWRLFVEEGSDFNIGPIEAFRQEIPPIASRDEVKLVAVTVFKKIGASVDSFVSSFPALELRFRDPDNESCLWVVFIQGRENVEKFIQELSLLSKKQGALSKNSS